MKKYELLLFAILIITKRVDAQEWELIYPQNEIHRDLTKAIVTPGSNVYYAVGTDIATSDNIGNTWDFSHSIHLPDQNNTLKSNNFDIAFLSEHEAIMVNKNQIFYSQNSGYTWSNQLTLESIHPQYVTNAYFNAVHFPTMDIGYAVGNFNKIFKTNDRGITWDTLSWDAATKPYRKYTDVCFLDEDIGYVSGYEAIDILTNFGFKEFVLKTNDGGKTWESNSIETSSDFMKITMDIINEKVGFAFGEITKTVEKVFVSNDSAKTWTDISPENMLKISCMKWIDANTGILFGQNNKSLPAFYKTINQGKSWYKVPVPQKFNMDDQTIADINFANRKDGFAVGKNGLILITHDSGESWQIKNENSIDLWQVKYTSPLDAFANTGRELYQTKDGGNSWTYLDTASNSLGNAILDFDFQNRQQGYAIGYNNLFIRSFDEFQTVENKALPVNFFLFYKYIHVDGDTIYIAGKANPPTTGANLLLTSSNSGVTWKTDTISSGENCLQSLQIVDNQIVTTTSYEVFSSTDFGKSWDTFLHSDEIITKTSFFNNSIGYVIIDSKKVIRTIDSGNSWDTLFIDLPSDELSYSMNGVLAIEPNLVYLFGQKYNNLGSYGYIWKSEDGGESWKIEEHQQVEGGIRDMFINGDFIYALGIKGTVIRKEHKGTITSIPTVAAVTDHTLKLYPNPVSQQLTIQNDIKVNKIQLYTINGNLLVETQPNQPKFQMNVSELPQGIYLAKVHTLNGIKSTILIKKD